MAVTVVGTKTLNVMGLKGFNIIPSASNLHRVNSVISGRNQLLNCTLRLIAMQGHQNEGKSHTMMILVLLRNSLFVRHHTRYLLLYTWYIILYDYFVVCVFFPFILDIKFVGRNSRGHTGRKVTHDFSSIFFLRCVP